MKVALVLLIIGQCMVAGSSLYSLGLRHGQERYVTEGRNADVEIEYMKLLSENEESATPEERLYLNYLQGIYQLDD